MRNPTIQHRHSALRLATAPAPTIQRQTQLGAYRIPLGFATGPQTARRTGLALQPYPAPAVIQRGLLRTIGFGLAGALTGGFGGHRTFDEADDYGGMLWGAVSGGVTGIISGLALDYAQSRHQRPARAVAVVPPVIPDTPFTRLRNISPAVVGGSLKARVDDLFRQFTRFGFGYSLGMSSAAMLLSTYDGAPGLAGMRRSDFAGNCMAFANAFAQILQFNGIAAEARAVRKEKPGRAFIVHVPTFIDPAVQGHIYEKGRLWRNYYLFTNHAATWVNGLNCFYDPMSKTSY